MSVSPSIRIATYNIHKCRGIDGRVSPERVADVIRDTAADRLPPALWPPTHSLLPSQFLCDAEAQTSTS